MNRRGVVAVALAMSLGAAAPGARATPSPGYDGKWLQLLPDGRQWTGAVLDPEARKVYVYGGFNWTVLDDLNEYDLSAGPGVAAWRRIPHAGVAHPRRLLGHAAAWDSRRRRVLIQGGQTDDAYVADVWSYDPAGPGWSRIITARGGPEPRRWHAAAYDSVSDVLWTYGGDTLSSSDAAGDLWALSFATNPPTWTQVVASGTGPGPQISAGLFVEAVPHRLVLVTGFARSQADEAHVFALSLSPDTSWAALPDAGNGPRDRGYYPSAYDPVNRRLLVAPGPLAKLERTDLWEFDLVGNNGWHERVTPAPDLAPHRDAALLYEPATNQVLEVGGSTTTAEGAIGYEADLWRVDPDAGTPWTPLIGDAVHAPAPRSDEAWALDAAGGRLYLFGGLSYSNQGFGVLGDVWSLDLAGAPAWRQDATTSVSPGARWGACGAFDSRRRRLIVFGGVLQGTRTSGASMYDLATGTWSEFHAGATHPSARFAATATYDSLADRVLVFGGDDGRVCADLWALELGSQSGWRELHPLGAATPSARRYHSAVLDTRRNAVWVYGGEDPGAPTLLGDAWRLDLAGDGLWSPAQELDQPPSARRAHGAVYDPKRDRMIAVWGAALGGTRRDDIEALEPGAGPSWRILGVEGIEPYPREQSVCAWDAPRDRMIMFGGSFDSRFTIGDLWAAEWIAPEITPVAPALALRARVRPNPALGGAAIEFTLSAPAEVGAAIYDFGGRLVRRFTRGPRVAGPVSLGWDGRDDRGAPAPAGVYAIRIEVAGVATSQKLVLLR